MKELALHEKTWLAAAIDGEGCLSLTFQNHVSATKRRSSQIIPHIRIDNTNPEFCKRAYEITGIGHFRIKDKRRGWQTLDSKHKVLFTWEDRRQNDITDVLTQILPFLIIKRERAQILINYIELRRKNRASGARMRLGERTHTSEELDMVATMKQLNTKGHRVGGEQL